MKFVEKYLKVLDGINKFLEIAIGIVLSVLIIAVFGQVLARFVHISVPILDEAARYLNLYMGFIAAAIAVRTNGMIKIDTMHIALKGRVKEIVIEISRIISIVFIAFMIYSGYLLFRIGIGQKTATLGFDMSAVYIIIPITFAFSVFNWIGHSLERWVLKKK
mgnify:CR=1 FL=1